ncbi:hypothetical protein TRVL_09080 [Trypanosoma vivax]|nr:hypothetical protein TRVL_09080 [Trypanosoma vivax]
MGLVAQARRNYQIFTLHPCGRLKNGTAENLQANKCRQKTSPFQMRNGMLRTKCPHTGNKSYYENFTAPMWGRPPQRGARVWHSVREEAKRPHQTRSHRTVAGKRLTATREEVCSTTGTLG